MERMDERIEDMPAVREFATGACGFPYVAKAAAR